MTTDPADALAEAARDALGHLCLPGEKPLAGVTECHDRLLLAIAEFDRAKPVREAERAFMEACEHEIGVHVTKECDYLSPDWKPGALYKKLRAARKEGA